VEEDSMNVNIVANALADINPWVLLTVGAVLIVIDLLLVQTAALAPIGVAVFAVGLLSSLHVNPKAVLWSIPIFLITAFLLQKKFYTRISKKIVPAEQKSDSYIGMQGRLKVLELKEDGAAEFYSYKNNIGVETAPSAKDSTLLLKIIFDDGEALPAEMENGTIPVEGSIVKVINIINEKAIIKKVD
jgi:membrane protein implicated in regulation of membrane protease activity